jgi:TolB-like protein/Flp pilus assembly protein TadD
MAKPASDDRLDSWKEIASFLKRGVRTVQRWEAQEGLPVHRHHHRKLGSVYALRHEVSSWWESRGRTLEPGTVGPGAKKVKLLVLPFQNLSGDSAQDYLSDGLTEEMIAQLAQMQPERLAVIARTTAMYYKGTQRRVSEIAHELQVNYLLEGSVRRGEGKVRITAQLIRAGDETRVWSRSYDRHLSNVLTLQSEAAAEIAREIHLALTPQEQSRLKPGHQVHPEAYEHYLKGRYHVNQMTPQQVGLGIQWLESAVRNDPEFALAHAALSHAHSLLAIAPFDALPPRQAMPRAALAVQRALQLDDSLPEAHAALAVVRHHYDWNWKGAEESYRRALALNPNYAGARLRFAWLLLALGRTLEALQEIEAAQKIAQEVDPHLMVVIRTTRAAALYFSRQYDKSIAECTDALKLDANYFLLHYLLGRCYARKGQHAKATATFGGKKHVWGETPLIDMGLALAHAVAGRKAEVTAALEQLQMFSAGRYIPATYIGIVYAGLQDRDRAFEWLEKAYEERADGLTLLNVEPMVDELRGDPRFQDLVCRIGFPGNAIRNA